MTDYSEIDNGAPNYYNPLGVASLELSQRLYELTKFDDEFEVFEYCQSGSYRKSGHKWPYGVFAYTKDEARLHHEDEYPHFPAYPTDYLLRKLPQQLIGRHLQMDKLMFLEKVQYTFSYEEDSPRGSITFWQGPQASGTAETPADALCELAIRLVERFSPGDIGWSNC